MIRPVVECGRIFRDALKTSRCKEDRQRTLPVLRISSLGCMGAAVEPHADPFKSVGRPKRAPSFFIA